MLQLMHAESARAGARYQWAHYYQPAPELVARFESASQATDLDWSSLEPEFAPT